MNNKRLVICERCGTKFAFVVPDKAGYYKIACPRCGKEIIFKVVNK